MRTTFSAMTVPPPSDAVPAPSEPVIVSSTDIVLVLDVDTATRVEQYLLEQGTPTEVTPHEQEGRSSLRFRLGPLEGGEFSTFLFGLCAITDPDGYGELMDRIRSGGDQAPADPSHRTRHDM